MVDLSGRYAHCCGVEGYVQSWGVSQNNSTSQICTAECHQHSSASLFHEFYFACTKWKGLAHNSPYYMNREKKCKSTNLTWDGVWEINRWDYWNVLPGKATAFYFISESVNCTLIILIFENSDRRGKRFKYFLMFVQQANIPKSHMDISDFRKNRFG